MKKIIHVNYWWWGRKDTIILGDGVAFCNLEFPKTENFAFIESLSVLPEWRKMGYGNKLIDLCIERVREEGWKKARLTVEKKWIQKWYERRGFKLIGANGDGLSIMEIDVI